MSFAPIGPADGDFSNTSPARQQVFALTTQKANGEIERRKLGITTPNDYLIAPFGHGKVELAKEICVGEVAMSRKRRVGAVLGPGSGSEKLKAQKLYAAGTSGSGGISKYLPNKRPEILTTQNGDLTILELPTGKKIKPEEFRKLNKETQREIIGAQFRLAGLVATSNLPEPHDKMGMDLNVCHIGGHRDMFNTSEDQVIEAGQFVYIRSKVPTTIGEIPVREFDVQPGTPRDKVLWETHPVTAKCFPSMAQMYDIMETWEVYDTDPVGKLVGIMSKNYGTDIVVLKKEGDREVDQTVRMMDTRSKQALFRYLSSQQQDMLLRESGEILLELYDSRLSVTANIIGRALTGAIPGHKFDIQLGQSFM